MVRSTEGEGDQEARSQEMQRARPITLTLDAIASSTSPARAGEAYYDFAYFPAEPPASFPNTEPDANPAPPR